MASASRAPIKAYLSTLLNDLERDYENLPRTPLAWGYPKLDDSTDGFGHQSSLSIVTAAPGDGTTAFLLTPLLHAALQLGLPVRVYLLEERAEAIARRIVSRLAKVPLWRLERGALRGSDWMRVTTAFKPLSTAQIEFVDVTGHALVELCDEVISQSTVTQGDAVVLIDSLDRLDDWATIKRRPHALRSVIDAAGVPVIASLRGLASTPPAVASSCECLLRLHRAPEASGDRLRLEVQRSSTAPARRYVDLAWLHPTAELVEVEPSAPGNQLELRL